MDSRSRLRSEALARLGVDRLAFGIHQSAFPPGEGDVGCGAPASPAGTSLLGWIRRLGFNAMQLGPDGQITEENPSPYDGTAFARNLLTLDIRSLGQHRDEPFVPHDDVSRALATVTSDATDGPRPHDALPRVDLPAARRAVSLALDSAHRALEGARARGSASTIDGDLAGFRQEQRGWLERDAFFEVLSERMGHDDPSRFDPAVVGVLAPTADGAARRRSMRAVLGPALERAELSQMLAQHQATLFRDRASARGVELFADLPIGWSHRDRFLHSEAFCRRWLLGAPPSRTNPEGQPWAYPLLDPDQLDDPDSAARQLFILRVRRLVDAYDGLRIDHPHGLVCPWVYPADEPRSTEAVRSGTRAFSSPDLDDADLRRWAIVDTSDLATDAESRWSERWVRRISGTQEARYARLVDTLVDLLREAGRGPTHIAAEVLSTCPHPLARVIGRHALGRFRVVQKANLEDRADPYRTDQARPEDWLMLGTHDTPPFRAVVWRWLEDGSAPGRARYLAERLVRDPSKREQVARRWSSDASDLSVAHLADLFLSDARNVLVYFTDLFGSTEPFNRAGVVHPDNWTQRMPRDFEAVYDERRERGEALDLDGALALALEARGMSELAEALANDEGL